jgi:hypothetical protein
LQKLELDPTPQPRHSSSTEQTNSNKIKLRFVKKKASTENIENKENPESTNWEYLKKNSDSKEENKEDKLNQENDFISMPHIHNDDNENDEFISDDFIKYNEVSDKILDQEEDLITTHMQIIKDDARLLTEEGELITNIKGVNEEDPNFTMEDYTICLDQIINKKISIYMDLKKKMEIYKQTLIEENKIKGKINPKFLI